MKFIYACIVMMLFCTSSLFAQIEKGHFFVSAQSDISYSFMKQKYKSDNGDEDGNKISNLEINPMLGRFIADGFLIGLSIPYSSSKTTEPDGDYVKERQMAIMPFVRYYIDNYSDLKPYFHAGFGYGSATQEDNRSNSTDLNLYSFELGTGAALYIRKNISLDLGLHYSTTTLEPKNDNRYHQKLETRGVSVRFGFSLFI